MNKSLLRLKTLTFLLIPSVFPTLISTKCEKIKTKEQLEKEILSNINSYSLFDEQIIFKQDNSPKNITIKEIDDIFLNQKIIPEKIIKSNIIEFKRWFAYPIDFRSNLDLYEKTDESSPKRIEFDSWSPKYTEFDEFLCFKKYDDSYKDDFLFKFKTNLFQGQSDEFKPKFNEFKMYLPSLDYENKPFDFDKFISFEHYDFFKTRKQFSESFLDASKKYLFFTGTNLSEKSDDIFYWMPYVKDSKLYFSRIIKNDKLTHSSLTLHHSYRNIVLKTYIFDVQKIKKLLNIPSNEELDFNKHVVIEDNIYYQNFSENYKKTMIWTKFNLLEKYSSIPNIKKWIDELEAEGKIRSSIGPHNK
ncbi:hypothetical protein ACJA25_02870 [Mycoplasmopsis hyopharyngis]|uniref:hypothetical protein n=1 Tax=Mycoplasmopsis hyopharyngis TaxID=29558 RepID=UPI003872ED47